MTYKELAEKILALPVDRQNDDVTISMDVSQEVIPAAYVHQVLEDDWASDILDKGHFIICVHH